MRLKNFRGLALFLSLLLGSHVRGQVASVGILGDSLSTGAGTHPSLEFNGDSLWDVFKGVTAITATSENQGVQDFIKAKHLEKPVVLNPGVREYRSGFEWVMANLQRTFSVKFLNTQEYSWGHLLGRSLGAEGSSIYIAGQNGARVATMRRQADRLIDHLDGKLPDKVFALYSGNDLCASHLSLMTSQDEFKASILGGLKYFGVNGQPAKSGTEILVVGFLGVTQLMASDSILDKKIKAFGESMTCRQLRNDQFLPKNPPTTAKHPETLFMSHMVPPNPARYCPTLFALPLLAQSETGIFSSMSEGGTSTSSEGKRESLATSRTNQVNRKIDEMLGQISSRVRQYRSASSQAVREANIWMQSKYPQKNIKFRYIATSEHLKFEAEDVAEDCFHLSTKGHLKVAKTISEAI
ncbi:MAG: hypothetical protein AB8G05_26110 [Oligoflexales bacterium]